MWKKRLAVLGVACMSFLSFGIMAHAGNINAAEQTIIDFYNGTFTYNGKTYQATEAAKSAAYNKLMQDDVDLTSGQAKSAIRQARGNIKQGIEDGYLVEVGGSGSEGGGTDSGSNSGNGNNSNSGGNTGNNPGGNSGNGNNPGTGNESGGNSQNPGGTNNPSTGTTPGGNEANSGGTGNGSGTGDATNPSNPGDPTSPGNTGTGDSSDGNSGFGDGGGASGFDWSNPGGVDFPDGSEGPNGTGNGPSGTGSTPWKPKEIDVDSLLNQLKKDKEHTTVVGAEGSNGIPESSGQITGSSFTVEQYLEGKAMAVTKDGKVLLETSLPIKNTGFYNGDMKKIAIIAAGVFFVVMLGVIWLVKSKKEEKAMGYVAIPAVFTLALAGIFALLLSGSLGNQLNKWNSLWIAGAPGYTYAYAQGMDAAPEDLPEEGSVSAAETVMPLPGDQYGEIACEGIGLQAPLYYGDSEEILDKGAGTYAGSCLPGIGGTILVGAHDATFFGPLEGIEKEDVVSLTTSYGKFQYRVTGTQVASLMDTSAYSLTDDEESLILYTCYPFGAEGEVRDQRFYVYAEKISGPEIGE